MTGMNRITLHHDTGDDVSDYTGFTSVDTPLNPGMKLTFEGTLGRATAYQFPYYKILYGGCGFFLAIGWPGQWEAEFDTRGSRADILHITAEQKEFAAYLEPNERIRTPLIAILEFDGRDSGRNVNLWRRWFMECNMRKINGGYMPHQLAGTTAYINAEMTKSTDKNQIEAYDAYYNHGVRLDYWWMDAGWYFLREDVTISSWGETGSWIVDTNRFPSKFRDISEHLAEYGAKTMLWFEPERTHPGTDLFDNHPEWRLGDTVHADMGNPDYRKWMLEHVFTVLDEGKISLYRQDWNIDPYACWRAADSARGDGRHGISENHYVTGLLIY
jgi:alpha-galactosidase